MAGGSAREWPISGPSPAIPPPEWRSVVAVAQLGPKAHRQDRIQGFGFRVYEANKWATTTEI